MRSGNAYLFAAIIWIIILLLLLYLFISDLNSYSSCGIIGLIIIIIIFILIFAMLWAEFRFNIPITFINDRFESQQYSFTDKFNFVDTATIKSNASDTIWVNTATSNIQYGNDQNPALNYNYFDYSAPNGAIFYLTIGFKSKVNIYKIPIQEEITKITYQNTTNKLLTLMVESPGVVEKTDLLTIDKDTYIEIINKDYLIGLSRFVGQEISYCIADNFNCEVNNKVVIPSGNLLVVFYQEGGEYKLRIEQTN